MFFFFGHISCFFFFFLNIETTETKKIMHYLIQSFIANHVQMDDLMKYSFPLDVYIVNMVSCHVSVVYLLLKIFHNDICLSFVLP